MPTATDKTLTVQTQIGFAYSSVSATIQAIADAIAAGAGTWSVVDNDVVSTNGRQILLKSSDADMANIKVAVFGGVTPNASAIRSNGSLNNVYIALHTDHASDTFDADFDAGAPLTGSGYVSGIICWTTGQSPGNAIRLVTSGDMIMILLYASASGSEMAIGVAGGIGRDESGNLLYGVMGTGTADMTTQWSSSGTGVPSNLLTTIGNGAGAAMWLDSADTQVARMWSTISTTILGAMTNGDGSKITLSDIPISDSGGKTRGYFKQMRIGPDGKCFTTTEDQDTGQDGIRISASLGATAAREALYLMQPVP